MKINSYDLNDDHDDDDDLFAFYSEKIRQKPEK